MLNPKQVPHPGVVKLMTYPWNPLIVVQGCILVIVGGQQSFVGVTVLVMVGVGVLVFVGVIVGVTDGVYVGVGVGVGV